MELVKLAVMCLEIGASVVVSVGLIVALAKDAYVEGIRVKSTVLSAAASFERKEAEKVRRESLVDFRQAMEQYQKQFVLDFQQQTEAYINKMREAIASAANQRTDSTIQ